jgi:hypothetical protein
MSLPYQGRWLHSFLDTVVDLHEVWIDVERDAVVTSVCGEARTFPFGGADPIHAWVFAMRTTQLALWSAVPAWSPYQERVDPGGLISLGGAELRLERDRLRWSTRWGADALASQRAALLALLLSPRLLLGRVDPLVDTAALWPVAPTPHEGQVSHVSANRLVDVLPVGRGHAVILELDFERFTLTAVGGPTTTFPSLRALLAEAIRIRLLVERDPCVVLPPAQVWDAGPAVGWEPWFAIPELDLVGFLPEFNGRYWAGNTRSSGEEGCGYGESPLLVVKDMIGGAEQRLRYPSRPEE